MGDIAIPFVFVALMAIEFVYNLWRGNDHQYPRDSAVSVMVMIPHFAALSIVPVLWVVLYRDAAPLVPWQLPADAWWIWPLGVVTMDLAAYGMHRYHHALNLTWAVHAVHHSSDELTITTGGRSSMAEPVVNVISGAYLFLVAPVALGLPLPAAAVGWLVKDTWGFAVHTRNVGRLGPLEWILATPSHHRVHHATNPIYRDKNYGFVFIVWDRLFGTFQPELDDHPPRYGVDQPPRSFRPLTVAFHHLALVAADARATRRWRDRIRVWFMPAGWRPADVAPRPTRDGGRYRPVAPPGLYPVGMLQLAYLGATLWHLASTLQGASVGANLAALAFVVLGTAVSGEYFERSPRYLTAELARSVVVAAMLGTTGQWFGRDIDGFVLLLIALAGTNLVTATWLERLTVRRSITA